MGIQYIYPSINVEWKNDVRSYDGINHTIPGYIYSSESQKKLYTSVGYTSILLVCSQLKMLYITRVG